MSAVHYSSEVMDWRTPRTVFDRLNAEFTFTVDGCATAENALLPRFWTERDEPLLRSWEGERVYINPPYGKQIVRWVEKAWTESAHALIVGLVPSRTDSAWWHDYVMPAAEIRFLRGRVRFNADQGASGRHRFRARSSFGVGPRPAKRHPMPDDTTLLGQNLVDFRDEGRKARQARSGIDLNGDILPLVFCTQDAMCGAEADGHSPDCPIELRLRDELGF